MMEGKTCVITGANSGIGREAARGLLALGAEVVLVCRNADKAEEARRDIVATTGRDKAQVVLCDLANQADIRRAAAEIDARFPRIDVLVNNAGLVLTQRTETVDGLEATLAVNHLAPLLLTSLLRDKLIATAREGSARVITVSSAMHWMGRVDFDDLQRQRRYSQFQVYADSKLMNVLFTRSLARDLAGTNVVANCMHPGVVATNFGPQKGLLRSLTGVARRFMKTPAEGADTVVWLASSAEGGAQRGEYFVNRKVARSSPKSKDMALAARLWRESERLVGLG
jgi:NAD(P)-dependent dehydrogenase (short-subunit alcohol dehydrogenase family)